MKRNWIGKLMVVSMCIAMMVGTFGCTTFKADVAKVEAKVESIDWAAVSTYWQKFDAGLQASMPVIEALFPGSKSTIQKVVAPVLADSNTAATTLITTIQAYKAGTLTAAQVQTAAQETQSAVMAASSVVGQALKGKVGVAVTSTPPAAATPAATKAVPTK